MLIKVVKAKFLLKNYTLSTDYCRLPTMKTVKLRKLHGLFTQSILHDTAFTQLFVPEGLSILFHFL